MNEFTKEELEDIYSVVMDTSIAILPQLHSKIKSMIDSYDSKGSYRIWLENQLRELERERW